MIYAAFRRCALSLCVCLSLAAPARTAAGDRELTEEMIFQPIETVITAGRTEQRIERAPATVTVISSEEIRASGAMNIPELLRYVPGLDVATVSSSHFEVNARGLNQILSNKMLVLVDGRSAYFDFFGGVIWPALQITMDQIDRIEVVRSPSSALYGANAFSGVINIITKNPRQIGGTRVNVQAGEQSSLYTSLLHGRRYGDTSLRFTLGARQMDSFSKPDRDFENNVIGNAYLEHRFDERRRLAVEGGLIHGTVAQNVRLVDNEFDATTSFLKADYEYGDFSLQAFWNRGDERGDPIFPGADPVDFLYNTFDLEAQRTLEWGLKHTLVLGGSYRHNTIQSNIIDTDHSQDLLAAYFQEEYRPAPEVSLLAGARVDRHPLVGTNLSPRGSVIYSPTGRHTFRLSVARAFRNPSFTDSYIELQVPLPPGQPGEFFLVGSPDLVSEKITTYELGYTFFPRHYFRAEIDLFTYRFSDYIGLGSVRPERGRLEQSYINSGSARNYGFEMTVDVLPASWARLSANYSFQDLTNNHTVLERQQPAAHKANFKAFFSLPRDFSAFLGISFVGDKTWEVPTEQGGFDPRVSSDHTRIDSRLAWRGLGEHGELFVAAYNLLDNRYREYPLGEEIRRRVTAGALLEF